MLAMASCRQLWSHCTEIYPDMGCGFSAANKVHVCGNHRNILTFPTCTLRTFEEQEYNTLTVDERITPPATEDFLMSNMYTKGKDQR